MSEALVVNPNIELKPVREDGQIVAMKVIAPVKGGDLHQTTVTREAPQLFGALLLHAATNGAGGAAAFGAPERQPLVDIGVLVSEAQVSTPVSFTCDLDELGGAVRPQRERAPDLIVNPTLRHVGREGFPQEMRGRVRLANRFRTDRCWLWIDLPDIAAPCVYSYSPSERVLAGLVPGQPPPPALEPRALAGLVEAGVVVSSSQWARDLEMRTRQIAAIGADLRERRYTVIPQVIAPLQLTAVRRYYRDLIAEGFLPAGDKDWPDRHFSGRDPIGYFFHHQLTPLVSAIAGQPLTASFRFLPPTGRDRCSRRIAIARSASTRAPSSSTTRRRRKAPRRGRCTCSRQMRRRPCRCPPALAGRCSTSARKSGIIARF